MGESTSVGFEIRKQEILKDYLFWLCTPQTATIKQLFDSLKDVLPDGNLIVTEDGLHLEGADSAHVIIVNMFLDADSIRETGEFFCGERRLKLGIDMKNINHFLKNIETRDIITLCVERNTRTNVTREEYLTMILKNLSGETVETYHLSLLTIDDDDLNIPEHKYTCVRRIPSASLQRYIKGMKNIGDVCKITNVNSREFRLSTGGFIGSTNISLFSTKESDSGSEEDTSQDDKLVVCEFKIKHMEYLMKPANLCSSLLIGIDDGVPLTADFKISSLGQLQYIIAQHTEE